MSRAERLLQLMQVLRRHRQPVSAAKLADELAVSLRTIYRDIASLQSQGAHIEGEAGMGYLLQPGFILPPLMFSQEEIEALVLGSRWVARHADDALRKAANNVIAKIAAVLPTDLRMEMETNTLLIGSSERLDQNDDALAVIREAIRTQRKLEIHYRDAQGKDVTRLIWPFAMGYFDTIRIVAAWCELRQAFRHFRTERILRLNLAEKYPRHRQALLKEWRLQEGIVAQ